MERHGDTETGRARKQLSLGAGIAYLIGQSYHGQERQDADMLLIVIDNHKGSSRRQRYVIGVRDVILFSVGHSQRKRYVSINRRFDLASRHN